MSNGIITSKGFHEAIEAVEYADEAGKANSATRATQDGNGNVIPDTYSTKADLEDHAKHECLIAGKYTITNGASTLPSGDVNNLEDGGVYLCALYTASGSSTITYSGIMIYQNHEGFTTSIVYVGSNKIVFSGLFIESDNLNLNGVLYCYKLGEISGNVLS